MRIGKQMNVGGGKKNKQTIKKQTLQHSNYLAPEEIQLLPRKSSSICTDPNKEDFL